MPTNLTILLTHLESALSDSQALMTTSPLLACLRKRDAKYIAEIIRQEYPDVSVSLDAEVA